MRTSVVLRIVTGCLLTASLVNAAPAAPSKTPPATAQTPARRSANAGWPATKTGVVAGGWVEAFTAGEKEMRAFLLANLSPESLERRSISARLATYREMHERYGALELLSIQAEKPGEITATLMTADASTRKFVFKVDRNPPHKLVSVGILETRSGGHFGFGH